MRRPFGASDVAVEQLRDENEGLRYRTDFQTVSVSEVELKV